MTLQQESDIAYVSIVLLKLPSNSIPERDKTTTCSQNR